MGRRKGHNLAEAAIAITLVTTAIWMLGSLLELSSLQLQRVENRNEPSYARLILNGTSAVLCSDGATAVTSDGVFEFISVKGQGPTSNPVLVVEVVF